MSLLLEEIRLVEVRITQLERELTVVAKASAACTTLLSVPHGARSVLRAATVAKRCGKPLDPLRSWALAVQARSNHNKATCALANKLARICYATLRDQVPFEKTALTRKLERQAFPVPA